MKNRFITTVDKIRSSYWFIPTLMLIFAVALSIIAVELDNQVSGELQWVIAVVRVQSTEAARAILTTIASSMITVAGVVFSLTMVVLSLTSQQYGPLVLRNFLRDRGNQTVLGTFTSTFVFCLLVLRTTQNFEDDRFVPHISVLLGIGFALASLAVLVYFIHHVSTSIQASVIITDIGRNLLSSVESLFPEGLGQPPTAVPAVSTDALDRMNQQAKRMLHAPADGYLQLVDEDQLFDTVCDGNVTMALHYRPGAFLVKGCAVATVWPPERADDELSQRLTSALHVGGNRTPVQDIGFLIDQLASIAVRALSPGVNDPYTAVLCIDQLGLGITRLANRRFPSAYRFDEEGQLRVITTPLTFEKVVHLAFDEIRLFGSGDLKVMAHLLETLRRTEACAEDPSRKQVLRDYMARVMTSAYNRLPDDMERTELDAIYAQTVSAPLS